MTSDIARAVIDYVDKRVPVTGHLGYCSSIEAGIDGLEHVWISPYNDICALNRHLLAKMPACSMRLSGMTLWPVESRLIWRATGRANGLMR